METLIYVVYDEDRGEILAYGVLVTICNFLKDHRVRNIFKYIFTVV